MNMLHHYQGRIGWSENSVWPLLLSYFVLTPAGGSDRLSCALSLPPIWVTTFFALCPYSQIISIINLFCTRKWRCSNLLKHLYCVLILHGVTSHKTVIWTAPQFEFQIEKYRKIFLRSQHSLRYSRNTMYFAKEHTFLIKSTRNRYLYVIWARINQFYPYNPMSKCHFYYYFHIVLNAFQLISLDQV
jgi:hypothetical protein